MPPHHHRPPHHHSHSLIGFEMRDVTVPEAVAKLQQIINTLAEHGRVTLNAEVVAPRSPCTLKVRIDPHKPGGEQAVHFELEWMPEGSRGQDRNTGEIEVGP